jgi:hypothetical protein
MNRLLSGCAARHSAGVCATEWQAAKPVNYSGRPDPFILCPWTRPLSVMHCRNEGRFSFCLPIGSVCWSTWRPARTGP